MYNKRISLTIAIAMVEKMTGKTLHGIDYEDGSGRKFNVRYADGTTQFFNFTKTMVLGLDN